MLFDEMLLTTPGCVINCSIIASRCYFSGHDKTMLIGADPSHVGDRCIRVTIHHCFFDGTNKDIHVFGLGRFIFTTITLETGQYMLFVPVLKHR